MEQRILEQIGRWLGQSSQAIQEAISETKKDDDGKEIKTLKPESDILNYLEPLFNEKLKTAEKKGKDEGYGRGKRESLESIEKEIAKAYGVERGTVTEMVKKVAENANGQEPTITPDMIRKSDIYIEDMRAEIEKRTQLDNEFLTFKTDVEKGKMISSGKQQLMPLFDSFVLPDAEKYSAQRKNQMESVINQFFNRYSFGKSENGEMTLLNGDGKAALDDKMNPIDLKTAFASVASSFLPQREAQTPTTPGGGTQTPVTPNSKFPEIKSRNDFFRALQNTTKPEDQEALTAHFKELEKAGKI